MISEEFTKAQACLLAWREEESNSVNGMLSVLFVLRTRVHAGWFGGDWMRNITAHDQFTSMSLAGDPRTVKYPDPREPQFVRLLQYVDDVFSGEQHDSLTEGAVYYADLNSSRYQPGGWFDRNVIQKSLEHPRVAQVGTTTYFK